MEVYFLDRYKLEVTESEIKNEMSYKDTKVLKYSIKYPQFTCSKYQYFVERLNQYYRYKAYTLARGCENKLYKSAVKLYLDSISKEFLFHEYEFVSGYSITYNENCALSLYVDQYQYEGGANGSSYRWSDNWNIQEGKEIKLNELFPNNNDFKAYIEDEIKSNIEIDIKNGKGNYFDGYISLVSKYFNPKDFYVTKAAVVLYYQEITIAPHSSGFPEFEFPYHNSQAIKPECCKKIKDTEPVGINPYDIRSGLLMAATDYVGVFTPEDAVEVWATGLKERSAALQYTVMTLKRKKAYAHMLENNTPNWVTGVSSPWIESYTISNKETLANGGFLFDLKFDTATSDGFWGSYRANIIVVNENDFWRIADIKADKELNIYTGEY